MAQTAYILTDDDVQTLRSLIADVGSGVGPKNVGASLFAGRASARGRQPPAEGMRIGKVAGRSAPEGTTDTLTYDIETFTGGSMAPFGVGLAPWLRAVPASDTETILTAAEVGALCVYWVGEMTETPEVGREVHLICVQGEGLAVGDCAAARGDSAAFDWLAVDVLTKRLTQFERRLDSIERNGFAASLIGAGGG